MAPLAWLISFFAPGAAACPGLLDFQKKAAKEELQGHHEFTGSKRALARTKAKKRSGSARLHEHPESTTQVFRMRERLQLARAAGVPAGKGFIGPGRLQDAHEKLRLRAKGFRL